MGRPNRETREIELDLGRYELRRSGLRVKLEKKPMELLIFLVRRREQLVTRQEIVAKLWHSDLFVDTEQNINNIVRKLRTALGDDPAKPQFVETVVGKGYRFVGKIRVVEARPSGSEFSESPEHNGGYTSSGVQWAERSSLAVVPLVPLGDTANDNGLCLGLAEDLISRLGNLEGVDVLPMPLVLNVPANAAPAVIAGRLGVRFVVHGALQTSKGQSCVSVEMFDAHLQSTCFARKHEVDLSRLLEIKNDIATRVAAALHRPLPKAISQNRSRYSTDALAYSEFMNGYRLSSLGDATLLEEAARRLTNAITRDPAFALAHAILSFVCATRHFEFDPSRTWLEKADFHCQRSLDLDPDLPEGHVAKAFLLWGPSKNFQHREAIAELKRALALQSNLPHAYNRLGTILAHIGLLDEARAMYERGKPFDPRRAVSHSIAQVYMWSGEYELAQEEIEKWRAESPTNKYALYFAPQPAMARGDWAEAERLLDEAVTLVPDDPLTISLQGLLHAARGNSEKALECLQRACASPKSFGHAHHTYYQIACILAMLGQPRIAFEWLERSVDTGFACWPFFMKDPSLSNLRGLGEFELLISSLQAKYPAHLGSL